MEERPIFRVRHENVLISGSVLSGLAASEQFDLKEWTIAGLLVPTLNSGAVSFQVSPVSGGTFLDLKQSDGTLFSVPVTSGNCAICDSAFRDILSPWRYVKIIVSAQVDGRTFKFVMKA